MLCCGPAALTTPGFHSPVQGAGLDLNVTYCCKDPAGMWCLTRALHLKHQPLASPLAAVEILICFYLPATTGHTIPFPLSRHVCCR